MKAQNSSKPLRAAGLAVLLCAVASTVSADVGGGRGYPATPWRIAGPKNAAELEKARATAAKCQALSVPGSLFDESDTEIVQIEDVSLRPLPVRADEEGAYELTGRDALGKKVSLSFSDIESFVVTMKTDESIKLVVTIWPDAMPEKLIDKQPTYKQLKEGYRREVAIEIPLEALDGRALEFAGSYGPTLPITKLTVGTKGDFYGSNPKTVNPRRFWWAIPSVAKDPEYPFRIIPLD
jgi:hypothetical protein